MIFYNTISIGIVLIIDGGTNESFFTHRSSVK